MSMHEIGLLVGCLGCGLLGYVGARWQARVCGRRIERETWKAASVFYKKKMEEEMEDLRWVAAGHHMAKKMANVMNSKG